MPAFENVVAGKMVSVTPLPMTCGLRGLTEYCTQTHGIYRECDYCQDSEPDKRHPPDYLTDIHEDFNQTWWQSVTMLEDVHTKDVKLTVNLGICTSASRMDCVVKVLSEDSRLDPQLTCLTCELVKATQFKG